MKLTRNNPPATPSSMRNWNEVRVLSAISDLPQRISALAEMTDLTRPVVYDVLKGLEQKGWVRNSPPSIPERGRPAQEYLRAKLNAVVLGIDLGSSVARITVMDIWGHLISQVQGDISSHNGFSELSVSIQSLVKEVLHSVGEPAVWITVMAISGHLSENGEMLESLANPLLKGRNISDLLGDVPCGSRLVVNDVTAAMLAERISGAAKGVSDMIYFQIGPRPGLGLLINGTPHLGAHGTAGEVSRHPLFALSAELDWAALSRAEGAQQGVDGGEVSSNSLAEQQIQQLLVPFTLAACVMDPEMIVIGGALTPSAELHAGVIREALESHTLEPPSLTVSQLDEYAASLGAALSGVQQISAMLVSSTEGALPLEAEQLEQKLAAQGSAWVQF